MLLVRWEVSVIVIEINMEFTLCLSVFVRDERRQGGGI